MPALTGADDLTPTVRNRVAEVALWLAVIGMSIYVGGTVYQMAVIVPIWDASPPESVRAFFQGTDYNRTVFNFFGPKMAMIRNLPLVVALIAAWPLAHRKLLLVALVCTVTMFVFTNTYIHPINDVLFVKAGGTLKPEDVRALADRWIAADRFRLVVTVVGYVALLLAFRLPIPGRKAA